MIWLPHSDATRWMWTSTSSEVHSGHSCSTCSGVVVDTRSRGPYALFVAVATAGHAVLAVFFSWLTSAEGGQVSSLSGVPLQVILTTLAGQAMWPLLKKIEAGERPEPGLLR